jgi:hypothetical protein
MSRKMIGGVLLLLLLLAAGSWWYTVGRVTRWRPALSSREVATRVLADELHRLAPAAKTLVMGNPFSQRSGQSPEIYAFEKAAQRGIEEAFGSKEAVRFVYPELRAEFLSRPEAVYVDPKTTTPLSFLVAEDAFDKLLEANPGYDLRITLIGLPVNLRETRFWTDDSKQRFGLLLPDWRMIGQADAIRRAFESEKILAAVVPRPGAPAEEVTSAEYRAEFQRRFILVTQKNVDEMLRIHPQLF